MIVLLSLLAMAQDTPSEDPNVQGAEEPVEEPVAVPDRSRVPDVTPPTLLDLPELQQFEVKDGVTAYIVPVDGVRKVQVTVWLHRGAVDFEGYVSSAHEWNGWLQDVATKSMGADDVAEFEDYWDADVWTSSGGMMRQSVNLSIPTEDLATGLQLMESVLMEPKYPGRDLKVLKWEQIRYLTEEAVNSPSSIAGSLNGLGWYPADSPYGARPDLLEMASVKRGDLRARHEEILANAPVTVLVVGDVEPTEIVAQLRDTLSGVGAEGEESPVPGFSPAGDRRILAVDMPAAEQTSIRVRMPAPLNDAPDRVAFGTLAWAYGGHFLSRINRNLREEKGITYGAGARYTRGRAASTFDIGVDVPADQVLVAMTEIERELSLLAEAGVTADELSANALEDIGWWNSVLQTSDSASDFYQRRILDRETIDAPRERIAALQALTPQETQQVAEAWLGSESARLWSIVGPREVVEPQLAEMGLPVQWIEAEDAILGNFE